MKLSFHQRYLIEEFAEDYKESRVSRRDMMTRVLLVTGSVPLAATTLFSLGCGGGDDTSKTAVATATKGPAAPTAAAVAPTVAGTPTGPNVAANDPAIQVEDVSFPGPASAIKGYLARPKTGSSFPAVVVIHENRGLVDQTKDVARRYAKEGFAAFAIDLLSRAGGTSPDPNANTAATGVISKDPDGMGADVKAAVDYLKSQSYTKAVGITGFCFGGGVTWEGLAQSPDAKAAVPYYGALPFRDSEMSNLMKVNAAVLAIFGALDTRVTTMGMDAIAKLKAAGKNIETKVEDNANHAFFNDTGASYNPTAAADAWVQTLAWFRKYLTA